MQLPIHPHAERLQPTCYTTYDKLRDGGNPSRYLNPIRIAANACKDRSAMLVILAWVPESAAVFHAICMGLKASHLIPIQVPMHPNTMFLNPVRFTS